MPLVDDVTTASYDRAMPVVDSIEELPRIRLEIPRTKVRYGRARLTIARFGRITRGELGTAISEFEADTATPIDVCTAFVRDRVVAHTPSFSWDSADLSLMLDHVVAVSSDPSFGSSDIDDVARVLVAAAKEERRVLKRTNERAQGMAMRISEQIGLGTGPGQLPKAYSAIGSALRLYGLKDHLREVGASTRPRPSWTLQDHLPGIAAFGIRQSEEVREKVLGVNGLSAFDGSSAHLGRSLMGAGRKPAGLSALEGFGADLLEQHVGRFKGPEAMLQERLGRTFEKAFGWGIGAAGLDAVAGRKLAAGEFAGFEWNKAMAETLGTSFWSSTAGEILRMRMDPLSDKARLGWPGADLQRLTRLARLPMFDARVQLHIQQPDWARLFPSVTGLQDGLIKHFALTERFAGMQRSFDAAARFGKAWREDPFWFVLGLLSARQSELLVDLKREAVQAAIFDALEEVVTGTDMAEAAEAVLGEVPYLSMEQRLWLKHGLEHARKREWIQAVPPLLAGFEGALYASALEAELIPADSGRLAGAESIIKKSNFAEDYELFARRLAFADRGQSFRHGRPKSDPREQVLILFVALLGWLDYAHEVQSTYVLSREMKQPLRRAVLALGESREFEPV